MWDVSFCVLHIETMSDIQIRAAHRINAAYLRQTKEKARDLLYVRKTIPVIV